MRPGIDDDRTGYQVADPLGMRRYKSTGNARKKKKGTPPGYCPVDSGGKHPDGEISQPEYPPDQVLTESRLAPIFRDHFDAQDLFPDTLPVHQDLTDKMVK